VKLDNNLKTIAIDANGSGLYQLHDDGSFGGSRCRAAANRYAGWENLDNNLKL